jgi:hypothetical protein
MKLGSSLKAAAEKSKKKDAYSNGGPRMSSDDVKYTKTKLKVKSKGGRSYVDVKEKDISKKKYDRVSKRYEKKGGKKTSSDRTHMSGEYSVKEGKWHSNVKKQRVQKENVKKKGGKKFVSKERSGHIQKQDNMGTPKEAKFTKLK